MIHGFETYKFHCKNLWTHLTGCNDNDDDGDLLRSYLTIIANMVSLNDLRVPVKKNLRQHQLSIFIHISKTC